MVSWAHINQPPKRISIVSAVFAQRNCVTNIQTDHATCDIRRLAIDCVCAMHVMWPKMFTVVINTAEYCIFVENMIKNKVIHFRE